MALVEMLSDIGLARLVVQDRAGDEPGFVGAIQGLLLVRGVGLSAVVFLFADPIAGLLGQPGLGNAYRVLAFIPLLRALVNLDTVRQQRTMRFGLMIKANLAGMAASLLALGPIWLWFDDYRLMLGLIVVENLARIGVTHLLAERPYRLRWSGAVTARAFGFGWPLLTGGVMSFAVMQGERLIVANQMSATDLGLFSAALTLALAPTLVVTSVVSNMFLPLLAREQDNEEAFLRKAELSLETQLAIGLALMVAFVIAGPLVLPLVYGDAFAAGAGLVAILGITYTIRMVRETPSNISMAKGHTVNLLIVSILRFGSFPGAFVVAIRGGSLEAVALTGVGGEVAALLLAYALVAFREGLAPVLAVRGALYGVATALLALLVAMAAGLVSGPIPAVAAVALWVAVFLQCRRFLAYMRAEIPKLRVRGRG